MHLFKHSSILTFVLQTDSNKYLPRYSFSSSLTYDKSFGLTSTLKSESTLIIVSLSKFIVFNLYGSDFKK